MRKLSPRLRALVAAVASRPRALLLLDYDGTLVPIRPRPDLAVLSPAMRATLARLDAGRLKVVVVSGRSVKTLKSLLRVRGIGCCGVFGLEASLTGWRWLHPRARALRPRLAVLVRGLRRVFKDVPGVLIEDKRAGAAVHHRGVRRSGRAAFARSLSRARSRSPRPFVWKRSAYAWEVLPRTAWDKGRAALLLWRRRGRPYLLAIGNDRFDEPMLRAAQRHGAGIRVGGGPSNARYRLKDPREVLRFLSALAAAQASKR